jgi:leucyl aminopeptidase
MKLVNKENLKAFKVIGFFQNSKIQEENMLTEKLSITEFPNKKTTYIYLGEEGKFNNDSLKSAMKKVITLGNRDFEVNAKSFVSKLVTEEMVVRVFIDQQEYLLGQGLYSAKTAKKSKEFSVTIFSNTASLTKVATEALSLAKSVNLARRLQATPPNICNSE